MLWHIALTEPGKDRVACDAVRNAQYQVYRPILPVKVRLRGHMARTVIKSMFPGYLFVIDRANRGWIWLSRAQGMRGARSLLIQDGRLATVENAIIDEIKAEEQRQATVSLKGEKIHVPYKVGDKVRIEEGPFCGLFGEVANLDDLERVCLLMNILGFSRVTMPHHQLASA